MHDRTWLNLDNVVLRERSEEHLTKGLAHKPSVKASPGRAGPWALPAIQQMAQLGS